MEDRIINIEKKLSSLETSVRDIRHDIQRVRELKSEMPTWLRNGAMAIFIAIFAQAMTSVWWASKITNTQEGLIKDVKENSESASDTMDEYHRIIIELNRLSVLIGTVHGE
jgi:hypothetical protein